MRDRPSDALSIAEDGRSTAETGDTMATKMQVREQEEARERLRGMLKPGDTVFTILRHVSRSGMLREISVRTFDKDGDCFYLDGLVARALGDHIGPNDGIKISGCGMDMGFEIVYELGRALWPDGHDCIGSELCRSNDHSNDRGVRDYSPTRHHNDGGYTLRQRWL
jgi:hypothetical protein